MAAQNLVLVTRTDNGKQFKVSTTKIVEFKELTAGTLLTYIDQRGKVDHRLVDESAAAIDALTGGRTQAVTLNNDQSTVVYINSDRIIYLDTVDWGTRITYDISGGPGGKYSQPPSFIDCTEAPAAINTAAGNTGVIITYDSKKRWVNGDNIDLVVHDVYSPLGYELLYDDKTAEFKKLRLSSSGNGFSIGSNWA